jgi:hypothetical protein
MIQVSSRFGWRVALVVLVAALGANLRVAHAQQRATDAEEEPVVVPPQAENAPERGTTPDWGTSAATFLTIPSYAFQSRDDSVQTPSGYNRFSATGAEVEAPVMLPAGAAVSAVELQGCDTDAASAVVFILFRVNSDGSIVLLSPLFSTGTTQTPGCTTFQNALTPTVTIDNTNTYYVAVRGGTTSTTSYTAVRVIYRLQVSPAPATASFPNDVPTTHPFFRYIEALKASGITGGCAAGSFCPDAPVTRGQMAVFLATALGLHFPN